MELARQSENGDFNNTVFQDSDANAETSLTSIQELARRSLFQGRNLNGINAELVRLTIRLKPFSAKTAESSSCKRVSINSLESGLGGLEFIRM